MKTFSDPPAPLEAVMARLEALIDWEKRDRAPGETSQGMRVDLEPITDLLSLLGRPEMLLCCVHVAGSKGKGSVSSLVAAGLKAAGLRVGRFASPHVERLTERVLIDGVEVADESLAGALEAALDAREVAIKDGSGGKDATWFDVLTAAALLVFRDEDLGFAVIECGLGGRLDSTNVIVGDVCVVTNIELEHTDIYPIELNGMTGAERNVRSWSHLRARWSGPVALIDLHIVVDPQASVSAAHTIAERVRSTLISEVEHVGSVEVHVGVGRMVASYHRSCKSYTMCE